MNHDEYIQIFNADGDPLFVELHSGKAYWILPLLASNNKQSKQYYHNFASVKYLSHLDQNGIPYFENLITNEVTWSLPSEAIISSSIKNIIISLQLMCRTDTEQEIQASFNEDLARKHLDDLDQYLLDPEYYNISNNDNNNEIVDSFEYDTIYSSIKDVFESPIASKQQQHSMNTSALEGTIDNIIYKDIAMKDIDTMNNEIEAMKSSSLVNRYTSEYSLKAINSSSTSQINVIKVYYYNYY